MSAWNPFRRDPWAGAAAGLYATITAQARQPAFYTSAGVPDSIDGRFEMLALHSYLVLRRLRGAGAEFGRLSQALVDALFADLDASLREMGAGDLGVGKRVKRMATGFYGRIAAYDRAMATRTLTDALRRNVFGTAAPTAAQLAAMVDYVERAETILSNQLASEISAGRIAFGPFEMPI
jgi:cytochrome b pre-mRNA-processing protein 3